MGAPNGTMTGCDYWHSPRDRCRGTYRDGQPIENLNEHPVFGDFTERIVLRWSRLYRPTEHGVSLCAAIPPWDLLDQITGSRAAEAKQVERIQMNASGGYRKRCRRECRGPETACPYDPRPHLPHRRNLRGLALGEQHSGRKPYLITTDSGLRALGHRRRPRACLGRKRRKSAAEGPDPWWQAMPLLPTMERGR